MPCSGRYQAGIASYRPQIGGRALKALAAVNDVSETVYAWITDEGLSKASCVEKKLVQYWMISARTVPRGRLVASE